MRGACDCSGRHGGCAVGVGGGEVDERDSGGKVGTVLSCGLLHHRGPFSTCHCTQVECTVLVFLYCSTAESVWQVFTCHTVLTPQSLGSLVCYMTCCIEKLQYQKESWKRLHTHVFCVRPGCWCSVHTYFKLCQSVVKLTTH